jgi:C4-dicarboxylate transporter DctM subunit
MERAYEAFRMLVNRLITLECWIAVVLFGVTGIVMVAQVFVRHVLNLPFIWAEDLTVFLFVWTTFLGAAVLFDRKALLSIDTLVGHLTPVARKRLSVVVDLVLLVSLFYFTWLAYDFAVVQKELGNQLGGATGIPSYVLTLSVMLGMATMFLSTTASLLKRLLPASDAPGKRA